MAKAKAKALKQNYGTGRRKEASARVFLRPGKGNILVNDASYEEYFCRKTAQMVVRQPLVEVGMLRKFDVLATVTGGGASGQAGAVCLGIARALVEYDEEDESGSGTDSGTREGSFRKLLRAAGLLTRDSREVESKKIGKPKARRGKQFSKR